MKTILRADLSEDDSGYHYSAFASDLQLGVGEWPDKIVVESIEDEGREREIQYFTRGSEVRVAREFGGFVYVDRFGSTLTIFND
jgi:hypothetical protein